MIKYCSIASGSNGNCYYVGTKSEGVLVDVGLTAKQIFLRMAELHIELNHIKAIFISHEHADHMKGVRVFVKKTGIPVYFSKKTFENAWNPFRPLNYRLFTPGDIIQIGDIQVHTFKKNHDASDPCSFRIESNGKSIGVFTDIGEPCDNVTAHFAQCHSAFFESNYDEEMLWAGKYPYHLKKRVASNVGHLSNKQAFDFVSQIASVEFKHLILSHLSGENNTHEKVLSCFEPLSGRFGIDIASRSGVSEMFEL